MPVTDLKQDQKEVATNAPFEQIQALAKKIGLPHVTPETLNTVFYFPSLKQNLTLFNAVLLETNHREDRLKLFYLLVQQPNLQLNTKRKELMHPSYLDPKLIRHMQAHGVLMNYGIMDEIGALFKSPDIHQVPVPILIASVQQLFAVPHRFYLSNLSTILNCMAQMKLDKKTRLKLLDSIINSCLGYILSAHKIQELKNIADIKEFLVNVFVQENEEQAVEKVKYYVEFRDLIMKRILPYLTGSADAKEESHAAAELISLVAHDAEPALQLQLINSTVCKSEKESAALLKAAIKIGNLRVIHLLAATIRYINPNELMEFAFARDDFGVVNALLSKARFLDNISLATLISTAEKAYTQKKYDLAAVLKRKVRAKLFDLVGHFLTKEKPNRDSFVEFLMSACHPFGINQEIFDMGMQVMCGYTWDLTVENVNSIPVDQLRHIAEIFTELATLLHGNNDAQVMMLSDRCIEIANSIYQHIKKYHPTEYARVDYLSHVSMLTMLFDYAYVKRSWPLEKVIEIAYMFEDLRLSDEVRLACGFSPAMMLARLVVHQAEYFSNNHAVILSEAKKRLLAVDRMDHRIVDFEQHLLESLCCIKPIGNDSIIDLMELSLTFAQRFMKRSTKFIDACYFFSVAEKRQHALVDSFGLREQRITISLHIKAVQDLLFISLENPDAKEIAINADSVIKKLLATKKLTQVLNTAEEKEMHAKQNQFIDLLVSVFQKSIDMKNDEKLKNLLLLIDRLIAFLPEVPIKFGLRIDMIQVITLFQRRIIVLRNESLLAKPELRGKINKQVHELLEHALEAYDHDQSRFVATESAIHYIFYELMTKNLMFSSKDAWHEMAQFNESFFENCISPKDCAEKGWLRWVLFIAARTHLNAGNYDRAIELTQLLIDTPDKFSFHLSEVYVISLQVVMSIQVDALLKKQASSTMAVSEKDEILKKALNICPKLSNDVWYAGNVWFAIGKLRYDEHKFDMAKKCVEKAKMLFAKHKDLNPESMQYFKECCLYLSRIEQHQMPLQDAKPLPLQPAQSNVKKLKNPQTKVLSAEEKEAAALNDRILLVNNYFDAHKEHAKYRDYSNKRIELFNEYSAGKKTQKEIVTELEKLIGEWRAEIRKEAVSVKSVSDNVSSGFFKESKYALQREERMKHAKEKQNRRQQRRNLDVHPADEKSPVVHDVAANVEPVVQPQVPVAVTTLSSTALISTQVVTPEVVADDKASEIVPVAIDLTLTNPKSALAVSELATHFVTEDEEASAPPFFWVRQGRRRTLFTLMLELDGKCVEDPKAIDDAIFNEMRPSKNSSR